MTTLETVRHEDFVTRQVAELVERFARTEGGCTARCQIEVESGFSAVDLEYAVRLRHNGRERHRVVIPRLTLRESVFDVLEPAKPWLLELHRFPAGSGIK